MSDASFDEFSRRAVLEQHLAELRAAVKNNSQGAARIHRRVQAAQAEIARIEAMLKEMPR